jgi:two-component system, cell cycle response regulator
MGLTARLRPQSSGVGAVSALGPRSRFLLRGAALLGIAALVFHVLHGQFGLGGKTVDTFAFDWVYDGVIVGSAASCLARAYFVKTERLPWLLLGIGMLFDAGGEIYYSLVFGNNPNPPVPSFDDVLYLLYYPFSYAGVVMLLRERVDRFNAGIWLDGAIAALTSAAVIAALMFDPILSSAVHGSTAAIITNLAYPAGDVLLLVIIAAMFALTGWRPGRAWTLLGIGLGVQAIADVAYAYADAKGTYAVGGWLDSMYVASALVVGFSAWQSTNGRQAPMKAKRLLLIPSAFALVAVGVLIYGGFHHVSSAGLAFAGASIVLVIARAMWTYHANVNLLEASRHEAVTDALTGLGNRRLMNTQLERALADGADSDPAVLVMFDLDGFKTYNDQFGHLAGDTLLVHLGRRLQTAIGDAGAAYRPGGDEFCVLFSRDVDDADVHIAAAVKALHAEGDGFSVGSSYGVVAIPREAETTTVVMRLADDRMYAHKGERRGSPRQQTSDVLLGLLREREPLLDQHLRAVGRLALLVGRHLGMNPEQLDELRRAAELHDVGKAAIPDAILNKAGPLTDHEWRFMHRHTLIGERILATAPALAPVARLVRSSHERWDGRGYPDGLAGEAIPLGARVVSVCDSFDAMTSDRPYARRKTPAQAMAELRGGAGAQFDPAVVQAFAAACPDGLPEGELEDMFAVEVG